MSLAYMFDWVSQNQKKMVEQIHACLIHRTRCVPEFCSFHIIIF